MRGGLYSVLTNFVATHLVVLSLIAFAVGGVYLIPADTDSPTQGEAASVVEPSSVLKPQQPPEQASPPGADITDSGIKPSMEEPALDDGSVIPQREDYERTPPQMIGGSLPIYERPAPIQRAPALSPGAAFRPADRGVLVPAPPPTRDQLVQQARRAFWNGDFEGAEVAYMAVISAFPEDADAFGELGNLYQSMGKDAEAMDAFFEAGIRLKALGNQGKLSQIIELFDKKGDERLQRLMP